MSKKMKVLIAVLVAILTLTVSGAVAVLAQENEEVEPDEEELLGELNEIMPRVKMFVYTESSELLSRVAEILGISEEELSDAFTQARQEMMPERCEEAFYELLEQAIEEGLITEEEAEEIKAWTGNKPAALSQLSPKPRIMNEVRGRHMIAIQEGWHGPRTYQSAD